jgi:hypothetical protein
MKKCIIVQGPTKSLDEIKKTYLNCNCDIIYSIWEDDENKYDKNDTVVINKKPNVSGAGNLFYQQKSTLNGFEYAKNHGYEYAIKMRSDMIPINANKFINLFNEELEFFYWHNYEKGYIVDYFMGGTTQNMIDLWKIDELKKYKYAEEAITNSFFEKRMNKKNYHFIGNLINENNDILWLKHNKYLSSYAKDQSFLNYIKI